MDPFPHHIFNRAADTIAPKLCLTINCSLAAATFPDDWKHAEINPILKKPSADPTNLKNVRPISLLPFPAKVLEKAVNSQLATFIEDHNILDISQSGFMKNHSTETALLAATDDIRSLLDEGETEALILPGFSAAFDTVSYHTLIRRLHEAAIRNKVFDWIRSFLTDRTQQVSFGHFFAVPTPTTCGVTKEYSLSPTLFNVYMAPLATLIRSYGINIISYAVDTQLILSSPTNLTKPDTTSTKAWKQLPTG
ncbi:hypothetical protein NDU88_005728 [Pleurodeles waltl]|uniref:Reverse transcriptase domain-containing protein n=1 Tax=Pleurodeles waltl TaxID=8319 RepID=A0AAV7X1J5_PLEWA|nr:hypothetical protein NDU88_005728 [Pleurodeles waltl]